MENLNNQNYFTPEWKAKYPLASEHFCKWIDEYKKRVNWNLLFNHDCIDIHSGKEEDTYTVAPKFHDLPIEMQVGILMQWTVEAEKCPRYLHITLHYGLNVNSIVEKLDEVFRLFEIDLAP